jgi:hypothetical protein
MIALPDFDDVQGIHAPSRGSLVGEIFESMGNSLLDNFLF